METPSAGKVTLYCHYCWQPNELPALSPVFCCWNCKRTVHLPQQPAPQPPFLVPSYPSPVHPSPVPFHTPLPQPSSPSPSKPSSQPNPFPTLPPASQPLSTHNSSPSYSQKGGGGGEETPYVNPGSFTPPCVRRSRKSCALERRDRPPQQREDQVTCCPSCSLGFGIRHRKHYCRGCGLIFCRRCLDRTLRLPASWGYAGPEKVCNSCYANRHLLHPPSSAMFTTHNATPGLTELPKKGSPGTLQKKVSGNHSYPVCFLVAGIDVDDVRGFLGSTFNYQMEETNTIQCVSPSNNLELLILPTTWTEDKEKNQAIADELRGLCQEKKIMPSAVLLIVSWSTPADDVGLVMLLNCLRSILNDFHTTFSQKVMGYGFLESQESLSSLDDKTHPKNRVPPKNIITVLRRNENFQIPDVSIPPAEREKAARIEKRGKEDEFAFYKWNLWKEERMELFRLSLLSKDQEEAGWRVHLCFDCYNSTNKIDLNGVRRLQIPNDKSPKLDEPWLYTLLGFLLTSAPLASDTLVDAFGPETIPECKLVQVALASSLDKSEPPTVSSYLFASMSKNVEQDTIAYSENLSGLSTRNRDEWYNAMFGYSSKENTSVTRQFLSLQSALDGVFREYQAGPEEVTPFFTNEEKDYVFLFVPGLYSGFFPGGEDAPDQFRRWLGSVKEIYGLDTRYLEELQVDGSCTSNAKTIYEAVKKIYEAEGKQVVLLGYSKGCADVTTFLCMYGKTTQHMLRGFTSMMGAFGGSAIASALYGDRTSITKSVIESVVAKRNCRIDALKDITLERRDALLREAPFPVGLIPVVSIVASIKDCSFDEMYGTYKFIHIAHKMESDGLICVSDQTVPGSCVVSIKGMNHAGAGEQNIIFRDPVPFIASMFGSVLRFTKENADQRFKLYLQPTRLIAAEAPQTTESWDKILANPIFAMGSSSHGTFGERGDEMEGGMEGLKLEERSVSSSSIEPVGKGSPDKKLGFESLNKTKLCATVVWDKKMFTTKFDKLTKHTIEIDGTQQAVSSLEWKDSTCFDIWSDQLDRTSKDILFVLEQHHSFRSNEILTFQRPLLKTFGVEGGRDCVRAVMLTEKILLLVNFLGIPRHLAPPEESKFANNTGLRLPTPVDPSSSIGKSTTIAGGLLLVGAATIVFPPLGLGMAVAAAGVAGATVATVPGKKEKQQNELKSHYLEFQESSK